MKSPRFLLPVALPVLVAAGLLASAQVRAHAPLNTDDASTLDKGGMKVEGVWSRDDKTKGGELLFGFSPVENLEIEVALARAKDDEFKAKGVGFGAKWVPYKPYKPSDGDGWSPGALFRLMSPAQQRSCSKIRRARSARPHARSRSAIFAIARRLIRPTARVLPRRWVSRRVK